MKTQLLSLVIILFFSYATKTTFSQETIFPKIMQFSSSPAVKSNEPESTQQNNTSEELLKYAGVWSGRWTNYTYGTTDSIWGMVVVDTENKQFKVELTTTGAFGNPDTVTFSFQDTIDAALTNIQFLTPPQPWSGVVALTGGVISGSITDSTLAIPLTIGLAGTFDSTQVTLNYGMTGFFIANGIIELKKEKSIVSSVKKLVTSAAPQKFELYSNYPNPFNPSTNIRFELPVSGFVSLEIYNLLGQKVQTLLSEQLERGTYLRTWDGRDFNGRSLSSGIYIYQIHAGEFVKSKRMLLAK